MASSALSLLHSSPQSHLRPPHFSNSSSPPSSSSSFKSWLDDNHRVLSWNISKFKGYFSLCCYLLASILLFVTYIWLLSCEIILNWWKMIGKSYWINYILDFLDQHNCWIWLIWIFVLLHLIELANINHQYPSNSYNMIPGNYTSSQPRRHLEISESVHWGIFLNLTTF